MPHDTWRAVARRQSLFVRAYHVVPVAVELRAGLPALEGCGYVAAKKALGRLHAHRPVHTVHPRVLTAAWVLAQIAEPSQLRWDGCSRTRCRRYRATARSTWPFRTGSPPSCTTSQWWSLEEWGASCDTWTSAFVREKLCAEPTNPQPPHLNSISRDCCRGNAGIPARASVLSESVASGETSYRGIGPKSGS